MDLDLTTQRDAARILKVPRSVVSAIVHRDGIPLFPHPMNGKARCLKAAGMKRLRAGVEAYKRNLEIARMACA